MTKMEEFRGGLLFGSKSNRDNGFFHWFSTVRLSRIILCILIVLVLVPIITHVYLSKVASDTESSYLSRNKLDLPDDLGSAKASELKIRIEEMLRIKISVNNELRDLEAKRQKLNQEISTLGMKIEELKNEANRKVVELDRIKLSITQAEVAHKEILERNQPELRLPTKLSIGPVNDGFSLPTTDEANLCSIYSCIDFSRCSIVSNFPVYVYPLGSDGFEERISASLLQTFNYNPHITNDPTEACLFIYVNAAPEKKIQGELAKLTHWGGDGHNHIIFNIISSTENISPIILSRDSNKKSNFPYGRAMIVQSVFDVYRPHFDLCVPPLLGPPGSDVWFDLPPMTPARRRYLLSFSGQASNSSSSVQSTLELLQTSTTSDEFYFEFQCINKNNQNFKDLSLCGSPKTRAAILQQSTFALISLPAKGLTSLAVQLRLYEALQFGAIPVVVGDHNHKFLFPYQDVIDWNRALIKLPESRLPELHFYIRAVTDRDILALRRNGRIMWEKYFGSVQSIVDSVIAVYRHRIGIPPSAITDEPSPSVFNQTFKVIIFLVLNLTTAKCTHKAILVRC